MKLFKWLFQCPLLFMLLLGWLGINAYTVHEEGGVEYALSAEYVGKPFFTALLAEDEPGMLSDEELILAEGKTVTGVAKSSASMTAEEPQSELEAGSGETAGGAADAASAAGAYGDEAGAGSDSAAPSGDERKDVGNGAAALSGSDSKAAGNEAAASAEKAGQTKAADGDADSGSGAEGDSAALTGNGESGKDSEVVGVTKYVSYEPEEVDSPYCSDPGERALTTEYPYEAVDNSYFDDAVFIGDSRTVGMQNYSGLDNATYLAKTGINVYHVLDDPFVEDPVTGEDVTVEYMLKHYQYGKIYFMIGINELGTGNTLTFQKAYASVVEKMKQWQPDAVIYIQGIIAVSAKKSAEDEIFNNININDKNVAISKLADGRQVFYLDVNPKLTDKKGNLKAKYTFDEIHLYAQYYAKWADFLKEHAVVRS